MRMSYLMRKDFFYALYDALSLVFLLIQKMEREIISEHQTCVKDEKDQLNYGRDSSQARTCVEVRLNNIAGLTSVALPLTTE